LYRGNTRTPRRTQHKQREEVVGAESRNSSGKEKQFSESPKKLYKYDYMI
jgi:hypothetical protein